MDTRTKFYRKVYFSKFTYSNPDQNKEKNLHPINTTSEKKHEIYFLGTFHNVIKNKLIIIIFITRLNFLCRFPTSQIPKREATNI